MKTPDEHETLLALSAQIKNGIEKGIATPNGKIIESINKVSANYQQVSKALCNKENATLEELLQAASQVKVELETVKRERDALHYDLSTRFDACDVCKHGCLHKNDCEELFGDDGCSFEWQGVCKENTEVQE